MSAPSREASIAEAKSMGWKEEGGEWHAPAKKAMAKKMGKIDKAIAKTGHYESPASKKAQKISDKKWASYTKERSERYKRDGITE